MVEEETEDKLILETPNVDIPLASTTASSLFSSRFVMVVSTQLVFAEHNKNTTLGTVYGKKQQQTRTFREHHAIGKKATKCGWKKN